MSFQQEKFSLGDKNLRWIISPKTALQESLKLHFWTGRLSAGRVCEIIENKPKISISPLSQQIEV
jgi:hypothetical protein